MKKIEYLNIWQTELVEIGSLTKTFIPQTCQVNCGVLFPDRIDSIRYSKLENLKSPRSTGTENFRVRMFIECNVPGYGER